MNEIRTNYLDASAIIKLLIKEEGSQEVVSYFNAHTVFTTTSLCFGEALGGLSAKYKREEIEQEEYLRACEELLAHIRNSSIEIHDAEISKPEVFNAVEDLIFDKNLSKKKRLDLSDAFQLVTMRKVLAGVDRSSFLLITADKYLARVAKKDEGVCVWYVLGKSPPPA
jgi:predicted nucleic acid-binding protein